MSAALKPCPANRNGSTLEAVAATTVPGSPATSRAATPRGRPSWSGLLRVSLVTVPVKAYAAVSSAGSTSHFHWLHADCNQRITNLAKGIFQCFHPPCAAKGNVLDLWAAVHRLPLYEAALHLAETFRLPRKREEEPAK